jgi:lactate dehydrogenase-like 2-hydroxyacid dehydrogenase
LQNAAIIRQLERCKVIANGGVGVDLDAATAMEIVVINVADVFIDEVANHAMMLLLHQMENVADPAHPVRVRHFGPTPKKWTGASRERAFSSSTTKDPCSRRRSGVQKRPKQYFVDGRPITLPVRSSAIGGVKSAGVDRS